MKNFLKSRFEALYFFYQYLGFTLFLMLLFSLLMVLLDSLGLAMFVPLLQVADNSGLNVSTGDENKLILYVRDFFEFIHLPVTIGNMLILIVALFVLKAVFFYFASVYLAVNQNIFSKNIRHKMILAFQQLSYKEYLKIDVGRLQNSLLGEAWQVVYACNQYLETIKNSMFVVIYLGFAFFLDWKFSILVTVGGLLSNFIYKYFYKKTEDLSRSITQNNHRYSGELIEVFNNYKYIKGTGRSKMFFRRLLGELDSLISNQIEVSKLASRLAALREPITIIIICAVIGIHVIVFKASLGAIMVILLFFYRVMQKIVDIQSNWNNYLMHVGSIENLKEFQAILDKNQEVEYFGSELQNVDSIKVRDLSLKFDEQVVLNNINLDIKKNETIALVGESGSGKTSLVNVISTLLAPTEGQLLINDKPFDTLNSLSYKTKIGYITQEATIFNATIFENITFWEDKNEQSLKKFNEVLRMCGLVNFVNELPMKEDSSLGNNGINISGGQKQRISIARELYRDIEILIMDEATSALDSETEHIIKESIESLKGKLTIIAIAHRLSTIRNSDTIYLLEKGQVIASGDFDGLRENSPYFNKLTQLQGIV